ncbi:hypothetical protein [Gracilibacillus massiliensis]|uniref:hypothetical protein n=1 Tax=Gracilibacillus massiliensis TaxID=1564956 RepID=UPI000AEBBB07|nr:hypothetical protein [Gracilibacillus massiliensis]
MLDKRKEFFTVKDFPFLWENLHGGTKNNATLRFRYTRKMYIEGYVHINEVVLFVVLTSINVQ